MFLYLSSHWNCFWHSTGSLPITFKFLLCLTAVFCGLVRRYTLRGLPDVYVIIVMASVPQGASPRSLCGCKTTKSLHFLSIDCNTTLIILTTDLKNDALLSLSVVIHLLGLAFWTLALYSRANWGPDPDIGLKAESYFTSSSASFCDVGEWAFYSINQSCFINNVYWNLYTLSSSIAYTALTYLCLLKETCGNWCQTKRCPISQTCSNKQ